MCHEEEVKKMISLYLFTLLSDDWDNVKARETSFYYYWTLILIALISYNGFIVWTGNACVAAYLFAVQTGKHSI